MIQNFKAKVELSETEKFFEDHKFQAAHGDHKSMISIVDLLEQSDSNLQSKIAEFLLQNKEDSIKILLDSLKSRSNSKKSALIGVLAYFRDEDAVEPLISLLKKSPIEIKKQVIQALGIIGDKKAILPLIHQLKGSNLAIKKVAIEALLQIDDERAIVPIIKELENSSDGFCNDIIEYLREDPSFIDQISDNKNKILLHFLGLLLRLLNSKIPSVVSNANAMMLKIMPFSSMYISKIIDSVPKISKHEIIKILGENEDETTVNYLIDQLKTPTNDIQKDCIQSLANNKMTITVINNQCGTNNFESLELIINCFLISEDTETSINLKVLLLKLRENSTQLLIDRRERSDIKQRRKINQLLSKMDLTIIPVERLIQELPICFDDEQIIIIHALGKMDNPIAVNPLINLIALTGNHEVRNACSNSLIKIKDVNAIPLLTKLQHHNHEDVRKIADATINGLKGSAINAKLINELTAERLKRKAEEEKRRNDEEEKRLAKKKERRKERRKENERMIRNWKKQREGNHKQY